MQTEIHLAIIGAGPAGAVTAQVLATARPDLGIVLLDAETQPRHRPCGEYLAPGGLAVLERIGLDAAVRATGACRLAGVALCGPGGRADTLFAPVLGLSPPCDHGLGVRRERFDRALQDQAAVVTDLRRGWRVRELARTPTGWRLEATTPDGPRQLDCRMIVGADGRGSLVRHRCNLDRPTARQRCALVCRAHGIPHSDRVEMHLGPLGQIGLCPLGAGEVNLNLLLAPASHGLLKRMPRAELLRAALAATPTLAARCRGGSFGAVMATPSLPQRSTAVVADGLCLVGDAAGFCDPFTGEGMSLALRGAEALALVLAGLTYEQLPSAGQLAAWTASYHRLIGRRQRIGEALQELLGRRRIAEAVAMILARVPLLGRMAVADAAGFVWGNPCKRRSSSS